MPGRRQSPVRPFHDDTVSHFTDATDPLGHDGPGVVTAAGDEKACPWSDMLTTHVLARAA
jgi:hypothetical protein